MKYADLNNFIEENNLLTKNIRKASGIYAVTIDNYIVYISSGLDVRQSCGQQIYEIENAMLTDKFGYLLLLSAKLGGHKIDCVGLEYVPRSALVKTSLRLQKQYKPFINFLSAYDNPFDLKIEDLLNSLKYQPEDVYKDLAANEQGGNEYEE